MEDGIKTESRLLVIWGCDNDGQLGLEKPPHQAQQQEQQRTQRELSLSPRSRGVYEGLGSDCKWTPTVCPAFASRQRQVMAVSCGSRHTLAATVDGSAFSWGWGRSGQLGHGSYVTVTYPKVIQTLVDKELKVKAVSAGGTHSAVIVEGGELYTFGGSSYGQLGLGTAVMRKETLYLPGRVRKRPASSSYSPATPASASIKTSTTTTTATAPSSSIAPGAAAGSTALPSSGDSSGGGGKKRQRLTFQADSASSNGGDVDVDGDADASPPLLVTRVSCGGMHTMAVSTDGELFAWGRADSGQLGIGTAWIHDSDLSGMGVEWPMPVVDILPNRGKGDDGDSGAGGGAQPTITSISCGAFHSAVTTSVGDLYTWGKEDYGMLGCGDKALLKGGLNDPHLIDMGAFKAEHVACGAWHTLVLGSPSAGDANGDNEGAAKKALWAFGRGEYGRIGLSDENCRTIPVPVPLELLEGETVDQLAPGATHTLLLTSKGRVLAAGRADDGRLGYKRMIPSSSTFTPSLALPPRHVDRELKFTPVESGLLSSLSEWKVESLSCGGKHSAAVLVQPAS